MSEKSELDIIWKEYDQIVELYKFYFGITIQVHMFFYGVTGGILAFYFANTNVEGIKLALILPIAISIILAIIFAYGAKLMSVQGGQLILLAEKLNLSAYPNTTVLKFYFIASSLLFLGIAIVITFMVLTT